MTGQHRGVVAASLTDPYADETTQPFWDAALEGRLVAPKCTTCGTVRLPPSSFCFNCRTQEVEWVDLPGTGTLYSFTVVRHPLSEELAAAVPYVSGVIELDGTQGAGARMIANVIDCDPDAVAIGDRVQIVWEKVSDTMATFRFRPEGP
jgi:uncharacterized OB-fold protein